MSLKTCGLLGLGSYQLVQVVLDPGQVGERADGHQAAQSEVKQLVAEKRDEPSVTMLKEPENTKGGRKWLSFEIKREERTIFSFFSTLCLKHSRVGFYYIYTSCSWGSTFLSLKCPIWSFLVWKHVLLLFRVRVRAASLHVVWAECKQPIGTGRAHIVNVYISQRVTYTRRRLKISKIGPFTHCHFTGNSSTGILGWFVLTNKEKLLYLARRWIYLLGFMTTVQT